MEPSETAILDEITLSAMRFHARVGVLPHEAQVPQPIEVDVTAAVDQTLRAPDVLDYVALYEAVAAVMATPHIFYLEEAADRIATAALALRGVRRVTVAVRKPHAPLPGPVDYAQVRITRPRDV